jgi:hypothetical protein
MPFGNKVSQIFMVIHDFLWHHKFLCVLNLWHHTSRNWPKCNHFICDYMWLLVICNYIWTFLQLFCVLVIFATTLQLICDYFGVHISM